MQGTLESFHLTIYIFTRIKGNMLDLVLNIDGRLNFLFNMEMVIQSLIFRF